MPFKFCFYGNTYDRLVIGENGVVSFDTSYAGQVCNWQVMPLPYVGNTANNNVPFPLNAIFGPYHDLDILSGGSVSYQTIGSYPCRKFVISYNNVPLYNCGSLSAKQQIVLYEATNVIEQYIDHKDVCNSWLAGKAVQGIQNAAGSAAVSVSGRNGTTWTATSDGQRYTPSGAPTYSISWLNSAGTVIAANSDTVTVCPSTTSFYVAAVTYTCGPNPLIVYDTVVVNKPLKPAISISGITPPLCNGQVTGAVTIAATSGLAPFTYRADGGTFGASGTFTGLAAGTHTLTARDANGCEHDTTITITEPAVIQGTPAIAPTSCAGISTVTINTTGGTAPYSYAMGSGSYQTTNVFTGIVPGTYTVHIKDANGCIQDIPVTVNAPATALHAAVSFTPIPCNNGTTIVTVTATGGLAPYQYAANSGTYQAGNTFTLGAGTHTITVKDNGGCTDDTTFTLTTPPVLGISLTSTPPACQGISGTITVTGLGGTPGYTYSLSGGTAQSSNTFNNLASGSYTVSVKDANGCTKDTVISLASLSPIAANAVVVPAGCSNGAGSITANPSGGVAPYTYTLNNGVFGPGNSFTGLNAGSYTLSILDANGCRKDTMILIKMSPTLGVTAAVTYLGCQGGNNGTITASATGGSGNYTYSLNGGTFQASNVFANLPAGTYTVTVKDNLGCEEGTTAVVNLVTQLAVTFYNVDITCYNGTGAVSMVASGGVPPYQYAINSGVFSSQSFYGGVPAGTYTFHIKDARGCQKDTLITLTSPTPVQIASFSASPIGCNAISSSVTVTATGGNPPYQYAYDNNGYINTGNLSVPLGTHTIHIRDANNCIKDTTITLVQPIPFTMAASYPAITCNGGTTTVTLSAAGSSGYTYSMAAGAFGASNVFANVPGGANNFHIKDVNGCIRDTAFVIAEPTRVTASFNVVQLVTCNGDSATVTLTGAGGTAPYTYALGAGTYTTGNTFKIPAGTYTFHVKDANGCIRDSVMNFANPTPIFVDSLKIVNVICYSDSSGSITLFAGGGVGPYLYSIDNSPFNQLNSFASLVTGNHTVKIKDGLGCIKDTVVFVPTLPKLQVTLVVDTPSCITSLNGSVVLSATGGVPPYQFSLNTGPFISNNTFTGLLPGTYTLHIRDSVKCIRDTSITIPAPVAIVPHVVLTNVTCYGAATGTINATATGGYAPYQYRLNSGAFVSSGNFTGLTAGNYTLSVKDNKNCIKDTTLVITEPPAIVIDSAIVVNPTCNGNGNGQVTVWAHGGVPGFTYAAGSGGYGASPVFTGLNAGTFTFHVKDANGCIKDTIISLVQPSTLQANVTVVTPISCFGGNNATVTLAGAGGTTPYTYAQGTGVYSSNATFTGLAAGSYTFHVKDAGNCIRDTVVTITQPTKVGATATVTPVLCFGQANGSVTLTGTGGTPGYTYAQGTGAYGASNVFGSLVAGSYTFHVKDTNGCIKDTAISITEPAAVQASVSVTQVTCTGSMSDGVINASGAGGTAPYTYALDAGTYGVTGSFTGLTVGSYTVHVKDANGCTKDTIIQLVAPAPVRIDSVQVTPITCNGQANGVLKVFASGGTTPYQYAINTGAFGSSNTFSTLASGTYTLTVKTPNGCTKDTIVTLTQPTAVQATGITITPVSCAGGSNGTITLSSTGGTPGYTYAIGTGAYGAGNTFGPLAAGTYTLHIRDASSCQKDTNLTITQPTPVAVAATVTMVKCNGESTGGVTLSANGGTPGYTYAQGTGAYGTSNVFSGLAAGSYLFHVKDTNGCIKDTTINITQPVAVQANVSVTQVTCTGSMADGTITAAGLGGTAPYTYALNTGTYGASGLFTGLTVGSYTVHVKDANGCIKDTVIQMLAPAPVRIDSVQVTPITCNGQTNGVLKVFASGGTTPYQYTINAGTFGSSNTFSNLASGTYTLTVKTPNGCTKDTVVTLTQPTAVQVTGITVTAVTCAGGNNGTITLSGTGGTPGYTYAIGTGAYGAGNTFGPLAAGTYTLHVRDARNCQKDTNLTITQPAPVAVTAAVTMVKCNGETTGGINLTATGGTPGYTYAMNNNPYISNGNFTSLPAATYVMHIKDANGCVKDTTITITQPQPLALQLQVQPITCTGGMQDGRITLTAAGGTAPYQYALNNGAFGSTTQFSNLGGGSYTIHLKDTNGCVRDTTVVLDNPAKLAIAVTIEDAKCYGDANGKVHVTVLSGNPQYTYQFGSSTVVGPTGGSYTFSNLSAQQNRTLTVIDSRGCRIDTLLNINQYPALLLDVKGADIACYGDRTGTIDLTAAGGKAPYKYTVNGTGYGSDGHIPNLPSGYYQVQVTDSNNCTVNKTIDLRQPDAPISISIDKEDVNCMGIGQDGWAVASITGGTAPYAYRWSFNPSLQQLKADSLGTGKYYFAVTDANNCKDSVAFEIDEKGCCAMFVPNAFSPNGDNNNDRFKVLTDGNIDMFDLSVFNRYGERVFNTSIYEKGWDGDYKGEKAEIGTYFYTVKYRCLISKQIKFLKGDVILLR